MYYVLYLASLCRRRHWPEPLYESYASGSGSNSTNASGSGTGPGYTCIVRVNNREYQTDAVCASESLARENAAMRAYLICRNFSVNDGKYPAGHDHGGVVQGIPVAIGKGRRSRSRYPDDIGLGSGDVSSEGSYGSRSGGSSPESYESERLGMGMRRAIAAGGQTHAHAHPHSHSHARAFAFARGV
ncbi:uncharacterized protein BDV17DRAFT_170739 [Aspergillus undulatus]|uniref:uncharacterized protein n=1 Tax=Aspergillus undulatus TaxID=1810928 RepID=UPI003CCD8029